MKGFMLIHYICARARAWVKSVRVCLLRGCGPSVYMCDVCIYVRALLVVGYVDLNIICKLRN